MTKHPDDSSPADDKDANTIVPAPESVPGEATAGLIGAETAASQEAGVAAGRAETSRVPPAESTGDAVPSTDARAAAVRDENASIARSAGIVSLAVMGSRVLGLVREQVMAKYFGAGFLYDSFVVAFRIPNLLRDLFAEGALSAAFVKTFTSYTLDEEKGEDAAWRLAALVMNALVVVLSILTIIGIIFSPQLVQLLTKGGFTGDKADLTVTLTRIMFPFLTLVALAAVAMGVLNTKRHFGVPASASTLFNVGSIIGGLGFAYYLSGGGWTTPVDPNAVPSEAAQQAMIGMAIGTLIGGGLQFLVQVPSLLKVGFRFRPALSFTDSGVRQIARLMGPAIIGTSAVQVNVVINTMFVGDIEGGASWLSYAFRLMQFPIGVFGVAVSTATLPSISKFAKLKDIESFRSTLASSIGLVFLLTVPSACGLVALGRPIISLIYERGAFTSYTTEMVALALAAYSVGLAGYAAIKVLSPAFYALDDARTPAIVSIASILINILASYLFKSFFVVYGYGHVGLALSTSCVALVNFFALALIMRRRIGGIGGRQIVRSFLRIALASLALSAASYLTYRWLAYLLDGSEPHFASRLAQVFAPMAVGGAVFVVAAKLLGVEELKQMSAIALRRFAGKRKDAAQ